MVCINRVSESQGFRPETWTRAVVNAAWRPVPPLSRAMFERSQASSDRTCRRSPDAARCSSNDSTQF